MMISAGAWLKLRVNRVNFAALKEFMKHTLIAGIIAASILLSGCEKKSAPPANSATPPVQAEATNPLPAAPPQPPSDAELFQKAAGVWKYNSSNIVFGSITENSFILATNGNFVKQALTITKKSRKNFTGTGTWQVKDGVLITTITKANPLPDGAVGNDLKAGLASGGFTSRNKILDVNDFELSIEVDATVIGLNGYHTTKKEKVIWTR
jgi:hypothetical protein